MAALTEIEIETRLTLLRSMASSGVLITRHGDTSVQFRSLDELLKSIRILEAQLGALQGRTKSRISYIRQSTRGFGKDC
jgi:flagellin-like hook-associated protein FlgL